MSKFVFSLIVAAALVGTAWAAPKPHFSLKGLELGQSRSALSSVASFRCQPDTSDAGADEVCQAMSTLGSRPALVMVFIEADKIGSIMILYKNPDHATFYEEIAATAKEKYGPPTSSSVNAGGATMMWEQNKQRYAIVHAATGNGVIISVVAAREVRDIKKDI